MTGRERIRVNFFRPSGESMKREVAISRTILLLWLLLSFGIPLAIKLAGQDELGTSWFTETRFLGFPLHYWLIAQGCTFGYVGLCKLYCLLWDRGARPTLPSTRRQG